MMTLDLRISLETDDGSLIHMTFTGIRDDAKGYFRTVPRSNGRARYAFLNRLLAVGTAEIRSEGPVHSHREISEAYSHRKELQSLRERREDWCGVSRSTVNAGYNVVAPSRSVNQFWRPPRIWSSSMVTSGNRKRPPRSSQQPWRSSEASIFW